MSAGAAWRRPPTDAQYVVPVTERNKAGVISKLEWRPMLSNTGQLRDETGQCRFFHYDERLWSFEIYPLDLDDPYRERVPRAYFYGIGTSSGCTPVRLFASRFARLRQAVLSFANMDADAYQLLVSDAEPTSDHPLPGFVAEVSVTVERKVRTGRLPSDYRMEYDLVRREGRVNGTHIWLFPTVEEVNQVMQSTLPLGVETVETLAAHGALDMTEVSEQRRRRRIQRSPLFFNQQQAEDPYAHTTNPTATPEEREGRSIQLHE